MKKLFCAILSMAMLLTLLAGCDLFTTPTTTAAPQGDPNPSSTAGVVDTSIKMTDKFSFVDPEGVEFDKRYVIYCDETSPMVSSAADYGMKASYVIYFAKEDAPVCSFDYYVCDTAENAQKLIDLYASQGSTLTVCEADPTVVYTSSDGDTLEGVLLMYQSYGMIEEATVSAYIQFMATSVGGTVQ